MIRTSARLHRLTLLVLAALVAGLASAPGAGAEQAGSRSRALHAGTIDAGDLHSCAVLDNGAATCWGDDFAGQLGDGGTTTDTTAPSTLALPLGSMTTRVADLSLTVTPAAPAPVLAGGKVRVTVRIRNSGPDPATAVRVGVTRSALTTGTAVPSQGTYTADRWDLGTLGVGEQAALVLTVTAPAAGRAALVAEITASGTKDPDSTPGNGATTEDDRAATAVTITAAGTRAAFTLTKASLSRTTFRAKGLPGTRTMGTTIRFTVNRRATTVLTVKRRNDQGRFVNAGQVTFAAGPGTVRHFFNGQVNRRLNGQVNRRLNGQVNRRLNGQVNRKPLTPGRYRLRIKATSTVPVRATARSRRLPFTIAIQR